MNRSQWQEAVLMGSYKREYFIRVVFLIMIVVRTETKGITIKCTHSIIKL